MAQYDVIIFDTGAGLSKETVKFISGGAGNLCGYDTRANLHHGCLCSYQNGYGDGTSSQFKLVINRAMDEKEGKAAADKISLVAERFLGLSLPVLGIVPDDPNVTKAVKKQVPFSIAFPASEATKSIDGNCQTFRGRSAPASANSGVKGFLHKMFRLIN